MQTVPERERAAAFPHRQKIKEESIMKKWAKGLSCAMAICLLTSGIGLAAAEGTSSTGTRMPNGYMSGLKEGAKNGLSNGLRSGLKNGATNGLKNGSVNGMAGGLKDGAKNGLTNGLKNGLVNGNQKGKKI